MGCVENAPDFGEYVVFVYANEVHDSIFKGSRPVPIAI